MSFDKDTRNALSKMVATCRRLLTEDVTDQLRGRFGMHSDGTILSIDRLDLAEGEKLGAEALRELLEHFAAGEAGRAEELRRRAYDRLVREISFTALNRLAALRLCEERGLVVECVRKGTASDGFRLFERVSGGALGTRYQSYRVFLECLFDELALDLGVLFDRFTPQSSVFPGERCLTDILEELNKEELAHLWAADETIGWIYQYFNPPEERKAMRDASQAPRNSRELAVRNQFFTPRYVVEFLTDNTLGRIWYEMRKGDTTLKEECRYLVRRPNEVFLGTGVEAPRSEQADLDLSQEELLTQLIHIEHRPKKDPREMRVLDPACGSGHFLLYAFDLLEHIYEEAWQDTESPKLEATGRTLREDFGAIDDLRRAVPKLVIEHNLHGIDIDPRAGQIAALALWLRAQKAWRTQGLKATERPRIERSNIATAEPMPGEEDMRREFTAGLKPQVLGQLVNAVFEKMELAGEAGSLLKIEEEIQDAVAAAKAEYTAEQRRRRDERGYLPSMAPPREATLFDFTDLSEGEFWEQAEDLILTALQGYAEQAENGRGVRRRLFANEAARGFAFIDVFRKRYDVVLMNPPFGLVPPPMFEYLQRSYTDTYVDVYGAFVVRGLLVSPRGRVGAITSRSFLVSKKLERWRRNQLLSHIDVLVDLGKGVMDDAMIDSAMYVLDGSTQLSSAILAVDLRRDNDPGSALRAAVAGASGLLAALRSDLLRLPGSKLLYFVAGHLAALLRSAESFEPAIGTVRKGMTTFDDFRFLRLMWEIPLDGIEKKWERFAKGGEYANYYTSVHLCVNRGMNATELAEVNRRVNGQVAQSRQGSTYYYRPGSQYTGRSQKGFSARAVPAGCVMSSNAPMILTESKASDAYILGWVNSRLIRALIQMQAMDNNFVPGILKNLPWITPDMESERIVSASSVRLSSMYRDMALMDETEVLFSGEELSRALTMPVGVFTRQAVHECNEKRSEIRDQQKRASVAIDRLYEFESTDLAQEVLGRDVIEEVTAEPLGAKGWATSILGWTIGACFGRWDIRIVMDASCAPKLPAPFDPLPVCPPGMLVAPDGLPAKPTRIASEEWLHARPNASTVPPEGTLKCPTVSDHEYPIRISWDGFLVEDPGFNGGHPHQDDLVRRVREVLDLLWQDKAHKVEQELCELLGVKGLRDYFGRPGGYFQDHLKRYSKSRRKAPIYWPLSTASGSYTIWLYYHRLNDQTLYAAVNKYVEPRIAESERAIARIEKELEATSGGEATRLRDRLNEAQAFAGELHDFREELLRIAALPYRPNLNDGVIINAAPFHKLFRLRSWEKDTEKVWKKLEKGDYDWAHLAYTLWPDRVKEVCREDRSIAITHGLEDLCEVAPPTTKGRGRKKGGKKKEVTP